MIDWRRIKGFVSQECRHHPSADASMVMEKLRQLIVLCGENTHGRQVINRAAVSLINSDCKPHIIAPCCPDYTHSDGRYTFRGLAGGISLLTSLHIGFLEQLTVILPEAPVTILIADQEAEDSALREVCQKTREEFLALVHESITATQKAVAEKGWQVQPFTEYMPDLLAQEQEIAQNLLSTSEFNRRLQSETMDRAEMYRRIRAFKFDEMLSRTARTAAQYIALGRRVRSESGILVNHTTTNLAWYAETQVGILHNPVCVY